MYFVIYNLPGALGSLKQMGDDTWIGLKNTLIAIKSLNTILFHCAPYHAPRLPGSSL